MDSKQPCGRYKMKVSSCSEAGESKNRGKAAHLYAHQRDLLGKKWLLVSPLFRIAEQMSGDPNRTQRGERREVNVTQAMPWHTNQTSLGVCG